MATQNIPELIKSRGPAVAAIYLALVDALGIIGSFDVEEKKTSIHFCNGVAFAGVQPRATALVLSLRTSTPLKSGRIRKVERLSKSRYHCEMLIPGVADVNAELIGWLHQAYMLTRPLEA